ncbi:hypothetical protein [Flavobacterium sp.]|uniref:hypothetical protein n=1 Tax=Flavobacterium sp. TaxID=239 RepID=UPI002B4AE256|nr:hypothetical protein [Flavobacterium sp.]HLF51139.1 hypothetical protein [Flavobacterium sp.]
MKNSILIGSAALVVVGIIVLGKNEKLRNMVLQAVKDGMSSDAVQDILEYAKNATIKEIQEKFSSAKDSYKPAISFVENNNL